MFSGIIICIIAVFLSALLIMFLTVTLSAFIPTESCPYWMFVSSVLFSIRIFFDELAYIEYALFA